MVCFMVVKDEMVYKSEILSFSSCWKLFDCDIMIGICLDNEWMFEYSWINKYLFILIVVM